VKITPFFLTRKHPKAKKLDSVFFNDKTPEGKEARRFSFLERKPGENNSVFF
jgi:hypothetical protein